MSDAVSRFVPADRIRNLPPYVFARVFALRDEALARGQTVYDMGVGNPDGRPPEHVVTALVDAVRDPRANVHRYSTFNGSPALRRSIAAWYGRRFGVTLDPDTQTLPLIGSKEGLANLMRTCLNVGDTIIIPSPCYPAYFGAARLCEARIWELELRADRGYQPDFAAIPAEVAAAARMLLLNYPNNPTGGTCDRSLLAEALAFCDRHDILLVSDIAYSELSLEPTHVPASVLQLPGGPERAVEFQSLSKSHNMAGWRVGFAAGSPEVIAALGKAKSNVDFSLFGGIQSAACAALDGPQDICAANAALYRRRRDLVLGTWHALGWRLPTPAATMYVWGRIPRAYGTDDRAFVVDLLRKTGVLLAPGSGFGVHGAGCVRASLGLDDAQLAPAMAACRAADLDWRS
ncbi:MAG: aminotransferase class I/II-fold pyridoxal phosphate-dependent enzyme [Candidatus Krumholzibacteriia bacterium]